jgi:ribosomal protein L7/L12
MLNLIKDWLKTATDDEIIELQKIAIQATPHSVIVKRVVELINKGHQLEAIRYIRDAKGIDLVEAKDIYDEIKYCN